MPWLLYVSSITPVSLIHTRPDLLPSRSGYADLQGHNDRPYGSAYVDRDLQPGIHVYSLSNRHIHGRGPDGDAHNHG
jgi:hypothetical protein